MSDHRHRSTHHRRHINKIHAFRWMRDILRVTTVINLVLRVQADWIDPDTPNQYYSTQPLTFGDHRDFRLVRFFAESMVQSQ
jgi:hypothetical protein